MRDAGAAPALAVPDDKDMAVAISPAAAVPAQVDVANDVKVPRKAKPHRQLAMRPPPRQEYSARFGDTFDRSPFGRSW
jgi:hypothetical protein